MSCICEGIECTLGRKHKTRRPVSNVYSEETNDIWHVPHFSVLCDECRAQRAAE